MATSSLAFLQFCLPLNHERTTPCWLHIESRRLRCQVNNCRVRYDTKGQTLLWQRKKSFHRSSTPFRAHVYSPRILLSTHERQEEDGNLVPVDPGTFSIPVLLPTVIFALLITEQSALASDLSSFFLPADSARFFLEGQVWAVIAVGFVRPVLLVSLWLFVTRLVINVYPILTDMGFPWDITHQLTEPLMSRTRKYLPPERTGGTDLGPLIWIAAAFVMNGILIGKHGILTGLAQGQYVPM
mmetsp:Transcript_15339/g.25326  ORF Transcript_15339/g.25326 Transcript_15339/m.25326 type:complete len:241 (+) Transcript_15339:1607-2329(+)